MGRECTPPQPTTVATRGLGVMGPVNPRIRISHKYYCSAATCCRECCITLSAYASRVYAQNALDMFPAASSETGKLPTCYGLATGKLVWWILGKLATEKMLTCCKLSTRKSATCCRPATDLSLMVQTCYRLVSDKMWPTCYELVMGKVVEGRLEFHGRYWLQCKML